MRPKIIKATELTPEQQGKWAAGRRKYFTSILRNPSTSADEKGKARKKLQALVDG
jgi:hypothetical protein